jgi:hypothetical protein
MVAQLLLTLCAFLLFAGAFYLVGRRRRAARCGGCGDACTCSGEAASGHLRREIRY